MTRKDWIVAALVGLTLALGAALAGTVAALTTTGTSTTGEVYCSEYARQTGVPTRWAAGACWTGTDGLTGPFYPLDPDAGAVR